MRVFVTGGTGFIGSHATGALRARGDDVILSNARITEPLDVSGADAVLHLAALSNVRASVYDPVETVRVNVEGTANVLAAAKRAGARVVMASSSAAAHPSASPYAASKRAAELVASSMTMDVCAVRFFTVYGPRMRSDLAIARFVSAALSGSPITVHGDGSIARDFTHVDDTVRGILAALDRAPRGYSMYELGAGKPVSLDDLIALVFDVVGRVSRVEHLPEPPGNVERSCADPSSALRDLGWSATISLRDGLSSVRDWISRPASGAACL